LLRRALQRRSPQFRTVPWWLPLSCVARRAFCFDTAHRSCRPTIPRPSVAILAAKFERRFKHRDESILNAGKAQTE